MLADTKLRETPPRFAHLLVAFVVVLALGGCAAETTEPSADGGSDGEASMSCTYTCGDVDNNGVVDMADRTALVRAIAGEPMPGCGRENGDVLKDGRLDDRDLHALAAVAAGLASGGCQACDGPCGDVTADGVADIADLSALGTWETAGSIPTACAFWAGDVDRNGLLNDADTALMSDYMFNSGALLVCVEPSVGP